MSAARHVALFLGSTRTGGRPLPAPLGRRVGAFIRAELEARGSAVDVVDPLELDLEVLRQPHFTYAAGTAPEKLEATAQIIARADAFVMVCARCAYRASHNVDVCVLASARACVCCVYKGVSLLQSMLWPLSRIMSRASLLGTVSPARHFWCR